MNTFEIGEIAEYHPSKWMQENAGCTPIELVRIKAIDIDGGIAYENENHRGHIGYERVPDIIKKLSKPSEIKLN